jgi:hypothetical protein
MIGWTKDFTDIPRDGSQLIVRHDEWDCHQAGSSWDDNEGMLQFSEQLLAETDQHFVVTE